MKHVWLTAVASAISLSAYAGTDGGNGGDVAICEVNGTKEYKMLDLKEAEMGGFTIDLGTGDLSVRRKIEIFLERLDKKSKRMSDEVRNLALRLVTEVEDYEARPSARLQIIEFTNSALPDVQDAKLVELGDNCYTKQLAIQKTTVTNNLQENTDPNLLKYKILLARKSIVDIDSLKIRKSFWEELSNDSKAMLILHEVFYARDVIKHFAKDSYKVRPMIGLIASSKFEKLTLAELARLTLFGTQKAIDYFVERIRPDTLVRTLGIISFDGITGKYIGTTTLVDGRDVVIVSSSEADGPFVSVTINGIERKVGGSAVFDKNMNIIIATRVAYDKKTYDQKIPVMTSVLLDDQGNVEKYEEIVKKLFSPDTFVVNPSTGEKIRQGDCEENYLLPAGLKGYRHESPTWRNSLTYCDNSYIVPDNE